MRKRHYERTDYGLRIPIEPEEIRKVKDRINIGDMAEECVRIEDEARKRTVKKARYRVVGKYRHLVTLQPAGRDGLKTESATYVEILMNERRDRRSTARNIRILRGRA